MQLRDLTEVLEGQTSLQRQELLKRFFGRDIEIRSMIGDVEDDSIRLDFIVGGTADDTRDWDIELYYDRSKHGAELLEYTYGDDVVLVARLRSAELDMLPTLIFDLRSIAKTGTTLSSRKDEQRKSNAAKCFIATACCGNAMATEVVVLRRFRDDVLMLRSAGRRGVKLYERYAPTVAARFEGHPLLQAAVRICCLRPLIRILQWLLPELRH